MLNIIYNARLFFEDAYKEISVREFSRESKISPPTASKLLKQCASEGLLISNRVGIYIFFRANRESFIFKELSKIYWYSRIFGLSEKLHEELSFNSIILFGSLAKTENTANSDVDLFVNCSERKINNLLPMERALGRRVEFHFKNELKNPHLKKNIEEGIRIR